MTDVTAGTIYHYADRAMPEWQEAYHAEAERRDAEMVRRLEAAAADEEQHAPYLAELAALNGSPEVITVSTAGANEDAKPAAAPPAEPAIETPKTETKSNGAGAPAPAAAPEPPLPPLRPFVPRPAADIPPRRWLHAKHYIRNNVVMTVAPGGYGKSSLVIANAIEMVLGRGILGPPPTEGAVRVAYWNIEDPAEEVERRIAAFCQHHDDRPRRARRPALRRRAD